MRSHRQLGPWSLDEVSPPTGVPLLAHVDSLIPASGRGPIEGGGHPLPDEPPRDPSRVQWGGAFDGLAAVGRVREDGDNTPLTAAAAVLDLTTSKPTQQLADIALERLDEVNGPHQMDRLLTALRQGGSFDRQRVATFARWICETGTRRQIVKAGIAMLGATGEPADRDLIARLGLLELLTLYSLVALNNLLPPAEAEEAIFDLAPQVEGWGRIHAILRLKGTARPDVRAWMVRGGASIEPWLTEEIAYVAATTGRLREAVAGEIDDELFDGAGELLRALAVGGPAEDLSDYADGAFVLQRYLTRAQTVEPTLQRLHNLTTIERYLTVLPKQNPHLSSAEQMALRTMVVEELDDDRWRTFVEAAFFSDDFSLVKSISTKAPRYGIDPSPTLVGWLEREPHDPYVWQLLVTNASGDELKALIDRAIALLPLEELGSGPADDLGGGRDYATDNCLGVIVQRLKDEPGVGWPLVRTALRTRVISTRNAAIRALSSWPRNDWPTDAEAELNAAMWAEPRDETRLAIRKLLNDISGAT